MPVTAQLDSQHPWPGLRAFTEGDRDFFFGREREIAELRELVEQSPAVVLYGQSGLGKTSLVQAGLFPELKKLDFLPLRIRFEHGEKAPPLDEQIRTALGQELDRAGVKGPRPGPTETLWEYFHRRDLELWGSGNRLLTPVIVVDQFEEIFTLGQRTEEAAARVAQFAADLESVLEHRAPQAVRARLDQDPDEAGRYDFRRQGVKFVISLREDFLGYLDSWARRIPSLLTVANRFRLQPMTPAQALEVVERGGRDLVDDAVARDIVNFVSDARHRVAPALLSVVLEELNHRRVEHGEARITAEFLSDESGSIIQDFYQRSFDGIDPRVRTWVEDRLLTGGGHRQSAAMEDALEQDLAESEFNLLVDRRILNRTEREGVVWLELTHDLLSDPASKSRAEREQRRQAEEAARRQEQFRRELVRSRRLAAVFGVLLVAAVAACILVIRYGRLARQNETARERTYRSAAGIADSMSIAAVSNARAPVAKVQQTIQDAEDSYQKLINSSANPADLAAVGITRARFLARAADALYEGGHYAEGLHWSSRATDVLNGLGSAGTKGPEAQLARAEILYETGEGSLVLNRIDDATADFTQALAIVSAMPNWKAREDASRVFILSQIGLGDRYSNACTWSQAIQHYQAAFNQARDFADARPGGANTTAAERSEAVALKIRAALVLGDNQWDPRQQQTWYAIAESDLKNAEQGDLSNPRWRAFNADLAYDQARAAYALDQIETATTSLAAAMAGYQDLINGDPLNWEWQLSLARSRHLLAEIDISLHQWDPAQSLLNQANQSATALLKDDNQSTWVGANDQRVSDLDSLSTIPLLEMFEVFNSSGPARNELLSDARMPENRRELEASFQPLNQADSILKTMESETPKGSGCSVGLAEIDNFRSELQDLVAVFSENKDQPGLQQQALSNSLLALGILKAVEGRTPPANQTPQLLKDEGQTYSALASVQGDLKQSANQVASEKNSIAAYSQLVKNAPTAGNYKSLSGEMKSLGDLYQARKNYSAAAAQYQQAIAAIDHAETLLKAEPGQNGSGALQYTGAKADLYAALETIDEKRGDVRAQLGEISQELGLIWQALPADFTNQGYLDDLNSCQTQLNSIQDNLRSSDPQAAYHGLSSSDRTALLKQVQDLLPKTDPGSLLAKTGGAWPFPPPFAGDWRTLARSEYAGEGILREIAATRPDVTPAHVQAVRTVALGFYGDSRLDEVSAQGLEGTLLYLHHGRDWVQLKGSADAVQKMNSVSPPQLDTVGRATAYVRFYIGTVQNADLGPGLCRPVQPAWLSSPPPAPPVGLYSIVDQASDIPWLDSATAQQRAGIAGKIEPLKLDGSPDHEWQARATIECGGDVYQATLRLSRSGVLNVSQANKISDQPLPVQFQFFSAAGLRIAGTKEDLLLDALARNPADDAALTSLVDLYRAGNQSEKEEQVLVGLLQRNPRNELALGDLIDLYQQTKQPQKTESLLTGMIQRDPGNQNAFARLAEFYQSSGQDDKEEALLTSDLARNPQSQFDVNHLMDLYNRTSQYGEEAALLNDVLRRDPANEVALRSLPAVYSRAKDWKNAVLAGANWVAYLNSQKPDADHTQSDLNEQLVVADQSLAWYQLCARDFAGALATMDAALKLDPADLDSAAERAEALLFLNRTQEAEAIFQANRGKTGSWDESWADIVLHDFNLLEKSGLTSPEMTRVRALLSAKPAQSPASESPAPNPQPH